MPSGPSHKSLVRGILSWLKRMGPINSKICALKVFADMEELGVRPDMQSVYRVARTYESLGLLKRKELVLQKYPPPTVELKRVKGGRLVRLRVYKHEGMIVILLGPGCCFEFVLHKNFGLRL